MIVFKTKDSKIVGRYSDLQELKEGEKQFSFDYEVISYHFDENNNLINDTTQSEIDERAATELAVKTKEDAIKVLKESYTIIWSGDTADGLKTIALILKNDGKTTTIEI